MDFGNNILRHGPVDDLRLTSPGVKGGEAPAKECPECSEIVHASYAVCPSCGHEFPPPQRQNHETEASTAGILTGQIVDTQYDVLDVSYRTHHKRGAGPDHPPSMRVEYCVGFNEYRSEWICFEHEGYARRRAEGWWQARSDEPVPDTVELAIALAGAGALAATEKITVRSTAGEKYDRIIDYRLGDKPPVLSDDQYEYLPLPEYVFADDDTVPF